METRKNYNSVEGKRATFKHDSMIKHSFRLNHDLNNQLIKFSMKKDISISEAIRIILKNFLKNNKDINKQIKALFELNNNFTEIFKMETTKIKKALLVIGKSNPISSNKIKEIFKDEILE